MKREFSQFDSLYFLYKYENNESPASTLLPAADWASLRFTLQSFDYDTQESQNLSSLAEKLPHKEKRRYF